MQVAKYLICNTTSSILLLCFQKKIHAVPDLESCTWRWCQAKNQRWPAFMQKYDDREDLTSREIIARAIDNEMTISGDDYVRLDCHHMDQEKFRKHFPNIYKKSLEEGIDLFKQLIPVVSACYYLMRGIEVDINGQSYIKNIFAVGECTNSGLQGINRLDSNSLLEGLV